MSQEDERQTQRLISQVLDAMNARNADALLALAAPDYEFHSRVVAVDARVFRGPTGFDDYFREIDEGFTHPHWELSEIVGWRGENLVLVIRTTAWGRESGVPIDVRTPQVWSLRAGKLWRNRTFPTKEEALEAASRLSGTANPEPLGPRGGARKNAVVVAAAIEALNARDKEMVAVLFDDAVEWRPALGREGAALGIVYRGRQGIIDYMDEVDQRLDGMLVDVIAIDPVGEDRVLYRARITARGSAGGIPVDVPVWGLWQIRNGKLFRGAAFLSEEEALDAAGLSE